MTPTTIHLTFKSDATGDMLIDKASPEAFVGSSEFVRAQGWRPIESAPRDGTAILAHGTLAGEINGPYDSPMFGVVEYVGQSDYAGFEWSLVGADGYCVWMAPTHWLPLPPAPKEGV